jgi:hypothetical protein
MDGRLIPVWKRVDVVPAQSQGNGRSPVCRKSERGKFEGMTVSSRCSMRRLT